MSEDYRSEIYKLLKIGENILPPSKPEVVEVKESENKPEPIQAPIRVQPTQPAISSVVPFDLPIVEDFFEEKSLADQITENILGKPAAPGKDDQLLPIFAQAVSADVRKLPSITLPNIKLPAMPKVSLPKFSGFKFRLPSFKGLMLYPVIFVISFAFFYVLLNFSSLVNQVNAWFAKPEAEEILKEDLVPFYTWIGGYYFSVQDAEMLEPANDIDKDGLSNMDEFVIRTNPTISDSDTDGTNDGLEIINGTNPWGEGPLTSQQKKLVEQMDVIKINNRVSYNSISDLNTEVPIEAPKIEYDMNRPGVLSIPKLKMQVPIIWTKDPKDFDADLTKGVVHYPGTALPGDKGTVYISGHSSDYLWKKHAFKQVFSRINALDIGDDIFIDIYGADGKTYNYRYRVSAEKVYKPDDQAQFIDNSVAKLNLSTCWPIGTQKDRYVVSATLVPL